MSETREQQARELAEQLVIFAQEEDEESGGEWFSVQKAIPVLARALAACALEEAKWWAAPGANLSHHGKWPECQCQGCKRIESLERAAEEGKS